MEAPPMCPLHEVPSRVRPVRVVYGLLAGCAPEFNEAYRNLFPHGYGSVIGGGCRGFWSEESTLRTCPECDRALRKWVDAHPGVEVSIFGQFD